MFEGIGPTELIVLLIIVLLFFGGKNLSEIGKGIGEVFREFKKSLKDKD